MTSADRYPDRVRLFGGRNIHAARPAPGMPDGITACGYVLSPRNDRHPADTHVNCRNCLQELNR